MPGFDKMSQRVRRKTKDDGTVVDIRESADDAPIEIDGGKVVSVNPTTVTLRTGETVGVDGYLNTGTTPKVGAVVVVARRGAFVLLIGEVVLL